MDKINLTTAQLYEEVKAIGTNGRGMIIETDSTEQLTDEVIQWLGDSVIMAACYRGYVAVLLMDENDSPLKGARYAPVVISGPDVYPLVTANMYVSSMKFKDTWINPGAMIDANLKRVFVIQVYQDLIDNHVLAGAQVTNRIIEAFGTAATKQPLELVAIETRDKPVFWIEDTRILLEYTSFSLYMSTPKLLNIIETPREMIPSLLFGILMSIPGYRDSVETIYKRLINNKSFVRGAPDANDMAVRQRTWLSSSGKVDGKRLQIPASLKLAAAWIILQCSLKSWDNEKLAIHLPQRTVAMSNILDMELDRPSVPAGFADECRGVRTHILSVLGDITSVIKDGPGTGEPSQVAKIHDYIKILLAGFEMASFMAIEEFAQASAKTMAHVMPIILREYMEYRKAYAQIKAKCQDLIWFRLLFPGDQLITSQSFANIKYAAIAYKKMYCGKSWAGFAPGKSHQALPDKVMIDLRLNEPLCIKEDCTYNPEEVTSAGFMNIHMVEGKLQTETDAKKIKAHKKAIRKFRGKGSDSDD